MLSKKVTIIGFWGTGKTSLVSRFVNQVFDDKYHATLGVKMDTKHVSLPNQDIKMVLWDIAGAEGSFSIPMHFIAGSAGYLLVLDGTRTESFDKGLELIEEVEAQINKIPYTIVVNKNDLEWEMTGDEIDFLLETKLGKPIRWFSTSAKTGENVENAFINLAQNIS